MVEVWHIEELIALVRQQFPEWDGFDHPPFVAAELTYKRETAAKARELIGKGEVTRLLAAANYDEFIARLERLGRDNNLLWNTQPKRGDMAILYAPNLQKWDFCEQMRALLYGRRPSPDRLQTFADYCESEKLPNKWPFATYFLFITRPHAEVFVKPRVAKWFLQFMGSGESYSPTPNADTYERFKKNWHGLKAELASYGAQDMIDIQSFIWVAAQANKEQAGGLSAREQADYDMLMSELEEEEEEILEDEASAVPNTPLLVRDRPHQPYTVKRINPPYSASQLAADTGFDQAELERWVSAIQRKQQAILYGPPGTGKTFVAHKLAQHLIAGGDGILDTVQFHPAYDYVDFVEGIRPVTAANASLTYEMVNGRFLDFCYAAAQRDGRCVLIIDEINRANLARVFGELMYLLEYREQLMQLASGTLFHIPHNVYLIGTMNTADRSIALVDNALRRRFAFIHLQPDYNVLRHFHADKNLPFLEPLIRELQRLNERIGDPNYAVGITFFLVDDLAERLPDIWRMEIEPYLAEYFFSQPERMGDFAWEQIAARLGRLR